MSNTPKQHLQNFLGAVFIVGLTLVLLEIALRVIDPWGLSYFNDLGRMGNEIFTPDAARGYVMPDGEYHFSYWSATFKDGQRVVPANHSDATCQLAILGDSVAFGYGVNDDQAWLNTLAPQVNASLHNYGVPRYNSTNVLLTHASVPSADAYMYLVVNNDVEPAIDPATQYFAGSGEGLPYIVRYSKYALYQSGGTDYVPPSTDNTSVLPDGDNTRRFLSEVAQLMTDKRVYLVSFAHESITNSLLAQGYDVAVVDYPLKYRISVADYHVNAQGNQVLGSEILPTLQKMVEENCSQK